MSINQLYSLAGLQPGAQRKLSGCRFEGERLERLLFGPGSPPEAPVLVEDCEFLKCRVDGEFRIAPGVILENVRFNEVLSPDFFTVSTQSLLSRVVISGGKSNKGLWVKPTGFIDPTVQNAYEQWVAAAAVPAEWMLDFSDFHGKDVEVVGFPAAKLKWDRERHVLLELQWKKAEAWQALNFPVTSFWRMRLKRLEAFGVTEGVYSLPRPKDDKYLQVKDEMLRLADCGLLRGLG